MRLERDLYTRNVRGNAFSSAVPLILTANLIQQGSASPNCASVARFSIICIVASLSSVLHLCIGIRGFQNQACCICNDIHGIGALLDLLRIISCSTSKMKSWNVVLCSRIVFIRLAVKTDPLWLPRRMHIVMA